MDWRGLLELILVRNDGMNLIIGDKRNMLTLVCILNPLPHVPTTITCPCYLVVVYCLLLDVIGVWMDLHPSKSNLALLDGGRRPLKHSQRIDHEEYYAQAFVKVQ